MKKILIMGLPDSGKTTLAQALKNYLESECNVDWFNADTVRNRFNDWDFTNKGRIRQSLRMAQFASKSVSDFVICDFVAPLVQMRDNFKADYTVWMDTIKESRFENTNKVFSPPQEYDFRIIDKNAEKWAKLIGQHILDQRCFAVCDSEQEAMQMAESVQDS